ncbi:MAG: PfkB family carbohydrate kinase [Oscillospiraceae bacterium]|nr:PfkB family carbohydrate kinase [Oscillospiraceae bacterium]
MHLTQREREILNIIKAQPEIEQSEIASRLHIARASVAVHISNLQKKGHILGRAYLVNESDYVVGIGAANVDIHGRSKKSFIMHDSNPGHMHISCGGVTRNISENCARLGSEVKLITALGDDAFAQLIRSSCRAAGVDASRSLVVPGHPSSTYISLLDEHGEMFVALSDMSVLQRLDMSYLRQCEGLIKGARLLVLDTGLSEQLIEDICGQYGKDLPIFAEPVSTTYAEKLKPCLGSIHTVKPNRQELSVLSGTEVQSADDVKRACEILIEKGVKRVFVSMGSEGCFYMDCEGNTASRALRPLEEMANATGAGDAFMAAVVYSFMNKLPLEKTLDFALAAGIAAISSEDTINPSMSAGLIEKIIKERSLS